MRILSEKNLKLKARIIQLYGSQEEFSSQTGIHRTEISKVISGRWEVCRATKAKYANRLECMIEEIFGG